MKIDINDRNSTNQERYEIWIWMTSTFGVPTSHTNTPKRWTYGTYRKVYGDDKIHGTHDIDWFDFENAEDAALFKLRWI